MVYVFLADGFEEMEALSPVDILRRAGIEVKTVGVTGELVTGAHGIVVKADTTRYTLDSSVEMIVIPGGSKGAETLGASEEIARVIEWCTANGVKTAAICAGPSVLGKNGALRGKKATCFPGFEAALTGAQPTGEAVCADRGTVTGKSAGHSISFGIALVAELRGKAAAESVAQSLYQNA